MTIVSEFTRRRRICELGLFGPVSFSAVSFRPELLMLPFCETDLIRSAAVLARNHTTAVAVEVRTLSAREALIVATEPLEGECMLLMIDSEHYGECLVECDVVHHSEYHRVGWSPREDTYSACRLRFRRVLSLANVHRSLKAAFGIVDPPDEVAGFEEDVEECSLMPVLSAIGILVVHISQTPWDQIL
jgi:hypothetical protein